MGKADSAAAAGTRPSMRFPSAILPDNGRLCINQCPIRRSIQILDVIQTSATTGTASKYNPTKAKKAMRLRRP